MPGPVSSKSNVPAPPRNNQPSQRIYDASPEALKNAQRSWRMRHGFYNGDRLRFYRRLVELGRIPRVPSSVTGARPRWPPRRNNNNNNVVNNNNNTQGCYRRRRRKNTRKKYTKRTYKWRR